MKFIRLLLCVWAFGLLSFPIAHAEDADKSEATEETVFFSEIKDIPVMEGLTELKKEALIFDKPWGRIVQVQAVGDVDQDQVLMFYWQTLPSLGWTRLVSGKFAREGELLLVDIQQKSKNETVLILQLEPR